MHWPVYVYTDVPGEPVPDITVEQTPLHSLHNANVVHDNLGATTAAELAALSTDKHLAMLQ